MGCPNCQPCKAVTLPWEILRAVFGERFWNDSENVICVPTNRITPEEWWELENTHNVLSTDSQYLIAEL